jgi:hypothetical protein
MSPETRLEGLKADGGLVLRSEAIAWTAAGARQADPIHDVVRMTVIEDQHVRISTAGPNVGRPPVTTTARGTAKEMSGNENENERERERRIEVAESPTVSPLAGIANGSGILEEADCLLALLGRLLGMTACSFLGTHQAGNAPVTQGRKKCVL